MNYTRIFELHTHTNSNRLATPHGLRLPTVEVSFSISVFISPRIRTCMNMHLYNLGCRPPSNYSRPWQQCTRASSTSFRRTLVSAPPASGDSIARNGHHQPIFQDPFHIVMCRRIHLMDPQDEIRTRLLLLCLATVLPDKLLRDVIYLLIYNLCSLIFKYLCDELERTNHGL